MSFTPSPHRKGPLRVVLILSTNSKIIQFPSLIQLPNLKHFTVSPKNETSLYSATPTGPLSLKLKKITQQPPSLKEFKMSSPSSLLFSLPFLILPPFSQASQRLTSLYSSQLHLTPQGVTQLHLAPLLFLWFRHWPQHKTLLLALGIS